MRKARIIRCDPIDHSQNRSVSRKHDVKKKFGRTYANNTGRTCLGLQSVPFWEPKLRKSKRVASGPVSLSDILTKKMPICKCAPCSSYVWCLFAWVGISHACIYVCMCEACTLYVRTGLCTTEIATAGFKICMTYYCCTVNP